MQKLYKNEVKRGHVTTFWTAFSAECLGSIWHSVPSDARMPAKRLSAPPRQAVEGLEDAVVFR